MFFRRGGERKAEKIYCVGIRKDLKGRAKETANMDTYLKKDKRRKL